MLRGPLLVNPVAAVGLLRASRLAFMRLSLLRRFELLDAAHLDLVCARVEHGLLELITHRDLLENDVMQLDERAR